MLASFVRSIFCSWWYSVIVLTPDDLKKTILSWPSSDCQYWKSIEYNMNAVYVGTRIVYEKTGFKDLVDYQGLRALP